MIGDHRTLKKLPINYNFEKKFENKSKLILEFFYFMEKIFFFRWNMKFKFKGTHPTFFENKIIFILKSLGGKIAISDGYIYLKWSEKV